MGVMGGHYLGLIPERHERFPWRLIPFIIIWLSFSVVLVVWIFITFFVPQPRNSRPSEKEFRTVDKTGSVTDPEPLPCWYDRILESYRKAKQQAGNEKKIELDFEKDIEPADLLVTVVVPAFNEEHRLVGMLEEAVNYLENEYGTTMIPQTNSDNEATSKANADSTASVQENASSVRRRPKTKANGTTSASNKTAASLQGWEILLVDDGSTDDTLLTAQTFSRVHILTPKPRRASGPWTHRSETGVRIPPGSIRMISLEQNRGKGGAVTHGMRHARGQYVVFADADGASKFEDLGKLVSACQEIEDDEGRGIAVGSRAHLVGSEAVVKRSKLRNFLMHSFHLLLKFMTPPATARIKDTQCGFKLFSRPTLPYIVPHMHTEGWIFDVEMLMLAEFANIPVVEVAIGWREVLGSKLNVIKDSIGMAYGLAILRICWGVGIYRR